MLTRQRVLRTKATGLRLPGATGAYASCPDSAALSITSDFDVLCRVMLTDWTPTASTTIFAKRNTGDFSWRFGVVATSGLLTLIVSADGTAETTTTSSVAPTITDGTPLWIRATWRASDGRVQFFTCADQATVPTAGEWTQLGTDKTANVGTIHDSAVVLEVGTVNAGGAQPTNGRAYYAELRNGIAGTTVTSPSFSALSRFTRSFVDAQGNVWSVNGSASVQ